MINFLTSLILASLLIPTGFNFLTQKAIDYSYSNLPIISTSPQRVINKSFGLKTTAESILIVDDESGTVLYNKNSLAALPIASITKLMTALVLLDTNLDWNKLVEITKEDQREGGIVYLLPGESVTVKDLWNLMLLASANEAAAALARNSGVADFPAAMNKKATELQMTQTYFLDPCGIEPANVSTAADLSKLAKAAFSKKEIIDAVTAQEYEFVVVNNKRPGKAFATDQLLGSFLNGQKYQIIGAKTGYLDEAGYCLLAKIKKIDGPSLIIALLGAASTEDRWQEAKGLVDWVFRNYEWPK